MFFLLCILVMHFVADFLLQTEWMALGKSTAWPPLLAHIGTYTSVLLFCSLLYLPVVTALYWAVLNGLCHLIVDYFSSRAMKAAREKGNTSLFFKILGLDQLLHYLCLFGILGALL